MGNTQQLSAQKIGEESILSQCEKTTINNSLNKDA